MRLSASIRDRDAARKPKQFPTPGLRCQTSDVGKIFFMLHGCFVSTVPKSPRAGTRIDRDRNGVRNSGVA